MFMQEKPLDNMVTDGGLCGIIRTLGCIGDSLSSGEHESCKDGKSGFHDYYEYSWGQYIARAAGMTVYNFSSGGQTAKSWLDSAWLDFDNPEKICQAYTIALGVNDVNHGVELGSADDIHPENSDLNADNFAGNMGRIISRIKAKQPKARIFLITMPRHEWSSTDPNDPNNRHAQLMYEIAEKFEFTYVIDLRKYGPVYDEEFRKNYYLGWHLNAAGYLVTARMIMSYMDYIIRHNMQDFAQIGFVGREGDVHHENAVW